VYNGVLEHCTSYHGQQYLDVIELHKKIYPKISIFQRNDLIGKPRTYSYNVGEFSPTTLRYVKVACDLDKFLGDLSGFKICEIGGGYGGQFLTLDALYKDLDYYIVDLRGALFLSKKYLDNYKLSSNITYIEPEHLENNQYDLIISNYAFSEFTLDIQNFYTDKILSLSTNGYITYNDYQNNFTLDDYQTKFKADIIEDYPFMCEGNRTIFWGASDINNKWYKYWQRDT
jgi:putative sugar O-methyltransferase